MLRRRFVSIIEVLALVLLAGTASGEEDPGALRSAHPLKNVADLSEFRMVLDVGPSSEATLPREDLGEFRANVEGAPRSRAPYRRVDLSEFRMSLDGAPISPAPVHGAALGEFRTTF